MRSGHIATLALLSVIVLDAAALSASDWPRWLGPAGNNTAPAEEPFEPDLNKWKIAWQAGVGVGYSSIAVSGGRACTMGHDGKGKETVYCLNADTGAEIWKYTYDAPLMNYLHSGGPNTTPTFVADKVITLGKDGQVFCLTADKGEVLWKANLFKLFGVEMPKWGFASSPFIDGDRVYFCSGKACALELATGNTIWISKTAYLPAGYATAPVFEMDGTKYVAALDGKGFSILAAQDGTEITRYPFPALFDMNATTPFILSNGKRIFISCSTASDMLAFDGKQLKKLWSTKLMRNLMNNCVIEGGAMYGINGEQQQSVNSLVSLREEDGTENWSQQSIGYGTTIGVGSTLLVLTERGMLIAVKADPQKYTELSRRQVLEKVCWTTPTYAHGKIYLRNDQGKIVVLGQ